MSPQFSKSGCYLASVCLAVGLMAPQAWSQNRPTLSAQRAGGYAGVRISGTPNTSWTIQFATNLASAPTWLPLATLTLSNAPSLVWDYTGPASGRRFYRAGSHQVPTNIVATNLVWLGPGSFRMGSPTNEVDRRPDETQHTVTLTQGFFIGKYLVTQGEFLAVLSNNPSYFNGVQGAVDYGTNLNRPVEQVRWFQATNYCTQLTLRERQAGRIPTNWVYRLPTEAEWEYACRAGTTNRFSYGEDPGYVALANYAWYQANSSGQTHPVGQKLANPWGLFDVHGNVYEWCQDWYGSYGSAPVINPQGPASGSDRVYRGGGFQYAAKFCRAAGRYGSDPATAWSFVGFRVVLSPQT